MNEPRVTLTEQQREHLKDLHLTRSFEHQLTFTDNEQIAYEDTLKYQEERRQMWLKDVVEPRAKVYGVSIEALLRVWFGRPVTDDPELSLNDLNWAEASDVFVSKTLKALEMLEPRTSIKG